MSISSLKMLPTKALNGKVVVPGDKSISHRAIIVGALAEGRTEIEGILTAEDCLRTASLFQSLGVNISGVGSKHLVIEGKGLSGLSESNNVLDAGNSGTTMRLISGVLAGQPFFSVLSGDKYLRRRPMKRIIDPLRMMGANIDGRENGNLAPLVIRGGSLQAIDYHLPMPSAQVKSAILLAGLYAQGQTVITESIRSRDHTERILKYFGVDLTIDGLVISLNSGGFKGKKLKIPGDISSASFLIVAALITKNSDILIRDVGINQTRLGIIEILREMGAKIEIQNQREEALEPIADIYVESSHLKGIEIESEQIPKMIDEFPIICVAASLAEGKTRIKGASELRFKESDRIKTMSEELRKLGSDVKEFDDGVEITGVEKLKGGTCNSHGDHRVAMSLLVAGLNAKEETIVEDTDCINTSFPEFMDVLNSLRDE